MINEPITKKLMESFAPTGRTHALHYDSILAFQNALRLAYRVKKEHPREDGAHYEIENSAATGTIYIRVKR